MMTLSFNIFSALLLISFSQGVLFAALLIKKRNAPGIVFLTGMIVLLALTNADYFWIASGLYKTWPAFFGISNGLIFLLGPLIWFYVQSVVKSDFNFSGNQWLHFIPYMIWLLVSWPWFTIAGQDKIHLVEVLIAGDLPLRASDYGIFTVQLAVFGLYILKTLRMIRAAELSAELRKFQENATERLAWLRFVFGCFVAFLVILAILVLYVFVTGHYSIHANYAYTLAYSAIIYALIVYSFNHPTSLNAGFTLKYQSVNISDPEKKAILEKMNAIMESEQLYLKSDLRINELAERLNIPSHQLSQIINSHFAANFFDFVNTYRIKSFKQKLSDPQYQNRTILSLAYECGFNSKSSFNTVFKRAEGMTPVEFKNKALNSETSGSTL